MSQYQDPDKLASAGVPTVLRVGYLVKRVQAALRAALDEAFRPLGLSVSQYAILEALVDIPESEATNAAIARRCFITPQSANEMIAAMTEDRLVSRHSVTGTRRIRFAHTMKDRERLADLLARCAASLEKSP